MIAKEGGSDGGHGRGGGEEERIDLVKNYIEVLFNH